jgi:hypothetical protein
MSGIALACLLVAVAAQGSNSYESILRPAYVVPRLDPQPTFDGTCSVLYDQAGQKLTWTCTHNVISPTTLMLNEGTLNTIGGVLLTFASDGVLSGSNGITYVTQSGEVPLSLAQIAYIVPKIQASSTYLSMQAKNFPYGAARGQLERFYFQSTQTSTTEFSSGSDGALVKLSLLALLFQ